MYISNSYSNNFVTGTIFDDFIENSGNHVTLYASYGNDTILGWGGGGYSSLNGYFGNDSIKNSGGYKVTTSGGDGNDTIYNWGFYDKVDGGSGNDSISNHSDSTNTSIVGGDGDDTIQNHSARDSTIEGGYGKDYISNEGVNVTISGGADDDTIQGWGGGGYSSLNGDSGNDSIKNSGGYKVTTSGGSGNDTIYNWGFYDKVDGGSGNDSISNHADSTNTSIIGGDGNDIIYNNSARDSTIDGGNGKDYISNTGDNVMISGGADDDTLWNDVGGAPTAGKKVSINGGVGNDYISNDGDNSTVLGGNDFDTIQNWGLNSKVDGGNGNDSIKNEGDNVTIDGGAGNDTLWNDVGGAPTAGKKVSINGGVGNDFISNDGDNSTVLGGNDSDTIQNWGLNSKVDGGAGNDSIYNEGNSVTISTGDGNDTITQQSRNNISMNLGAGNDYVFNGWGSTNITIDAGTGNDFLNNDGSKLSLSGGEGNDSISLYGGEDITVSGGKGNDTIWNNTAKNVLYKYAKGDGNDYIQGFKENSTLSINAQTAPLSIKSGSDIILTVSGGQITLQGAGNLSTVNIIETPANIHNSDNNTIVTTTNASDTITNTGDKATIRGLKGNDSIDNKAQNVSIDAGEGNDKISNKAKNVTIAPQNGNDSINNEANNVTIAGGAGNDTLFNNGEKVTISGGSDNDVIENYTKSNNVSIAGEAGNDSIKNEANNVTILGGAGNDSISGKSTATSILGGDGNDLISVQSSYKNTIIGGSGSDTIKLDWSSNEALIKHSKGDGNDVIEGFNSTDTLQLGDGTQTYSRTDSGTDIIITDEGGEKITLKGAATLSSVHIGGVTTLKVDNTKNETLISGDRLNDSIKNNGYEVTISAGAGADTISNYASNVTISADADADYIENNNANNTSISGGDGNDKISISNGEKNTINGGLGADSISISSSNEAVIQYNSGDGSDYISGFNETSTLQIDDGKTIYFKSITGGNVIISVGKDEITLAGAATLSTLNIIGEEETIGANIVNNKNNTSIICTDANDTIKNTGKNVTILGNGGRDSISNHTSEVTILSGAGNDFVFNNRGDNSLVDGGKGNNYIYNNAKNVIINSGTGNDSIYNRSEKVTIKTGSGNDSITNIDNEISIEAGDGNDSITNGGYYYRGDTHFDGTNVTINGGKGDDFIRNSWDYLIGGVDSKPINVLFTYDSGDGNDVIYGFNETSTLSISGDYYSSEKSGNDLILTVGDGKITLKGAAGLSTFNIIGEEKISALNIDNTENGTLITGTENNDTIKNNGEDVTIQAQDGNDTISNHYAQFVEIVAGAGNDSIFNNANFTTLDGGNGDDSITNANGYFSSISGAEGADLISITNSDDATLNGGAGDDSIKLDSGNNALIEYKAGDGNDLIEGFSKNSTLLIVDDYSTTKSGSDIIVTVGEDKITLKGAANLSNVNITDEYNEDDEEENDDDNFVNSTIKDSRATYKTYKPAVAIKSSYQYNKNYSVLNVSSALDNPVKITNGENSSIKANVAFGTAILTSENSGDKITFSEDTSFNYGDIQADVFKGSVLSTNGAKEITFTNNSSAKIMAPACAKININSGTFIINDLPVKSDNGAGTITVEKDGMSFTGYGVQFVDLEVAKESYFGKLTPMTADYNFADKSYTIQNAAQVKTLSNVFTKITFDISADENASFKVNGKEFLVASDADNINVVEANRSTFKIQGKEIDAEKIGRVTIDEQITFSGTQIDFDGVKVNYALNKPVIYSLDGKEITISDAATLTTGDETKTFKCEAGSYVVNGRTFETSTDLTFTADANEIRIPLSDAATEIYFDGVQVSYVSDGGEIVFNGDKVTIPDGANLNITSPEEVKLNLAAGNFSIDYKDISIDNELEITVDKDNIKIPLSENPVTINKAKITGNGEMTVDNTEAGFFSILLPDGALVENTSVNTFALKGKGTSASFGDANKKVQLTDDGTAYIKFDNEKGIGVGFNTLMFEHVEIEGVDAWTVETSGTHGIDKITGITNGATVSTSTKDIDAGDLRFEVETTGAGEFTICGQKFTSDTDTKNIYVVSYSPEGEIQVAPQGEEYKDDDSEAAGKVYEFKTAGDYTLNGITFHAAENTKAQTITRGVELDLSTGAFEYDGLTLSGGGTAQINRYNPSLISLTNGAKVSGSDATKYQNRQFEISGAVELIGKKFETDEQIRCALINVESSLDFEINDENISIPFTISGFVANDKYVQIQNDCYDGVKVVGKKISSIEGVKNSAHIIGNGLSDISIVTTSSGEFRIRNKNYTISNDSDGVTFVTDSHGNISEINGLAGSVEGNFENAISINGKAIRLTGASSIKVTSDGEKITEISNVAGDLLETDGNTYRKNVRVYELGGADKLLTSADGTIIFHGNKFETSAGKTFNLDEAGNISSIEKAQSETANVSANVLEEEPSTENFAIINLTTTDNLEKVFGDFSEGVIVNGVFVKVTDSTNFVVKNDDQNVYIETTAPDTFTINGKTFTTSTDKTIFKLSASGNVSEIVTDSFYSDKAAYLIEGDFSDEIIFNGQKFCVTGTNDTSIFIGDETLISVNLARNNIKVVESGGASEIAVHGGGEITIGGKTFTTSNDFVGTLKTNSIENFVGTIEGELGGLELSGITIDSEDKFSVTGDGEKVTALENLQNGSVTGNLDAITINGAKISIDDSDEVTLTIADGKLKISGENNAEEITDMFTGDAAKIVAAGSRATVTNYDYKSGEAFRTGYENIAEAIEENSIAYDDGKLNVNSSRVTFAEHAESRIINFVDAAGDLQKVGFASDDSKLDASKEIGNLILVGGINSTITGGKGKNQIYLKENGESTIILNGKNTIENFNEGFDGDKISISANCDFSFDGEKVKIKSGAARATLQNISSGDDAARILTLINGKETKTAIAQEGAVIAAGDDTADAYYGKKSGVDFTGFEETLTVDLRENFSGINRVTVGGGQNTQISSSRNETLTSNGTTEFIFSKDSGRDLIQNFNFENDKISVGNETITAVNVNNAGGVRMEISGSAMLTLENAQGKNFQINNFVALVDKNLTYNDAANYYVATSRNASLTVGEGAQIWLDGSHGKYFSGEIRTLDATTSTGKSELAGNDLDNRIFAGQGDASLWGGNLGDDLLVGGTGKNTFFYTNGNGNDTIGGANNGDVVYLSQVTLEQIASTNITADSVAINFKDGGSLQINSAADVTYQLTDGSKFSANHANLSWESR